MVVMGGLSNQITQYIPTLQTHPRFDSTGAAVQLATPSPCLILPGPGLETVEPMIEANALKWKHREDSDQVMPTLAAKQQGRESILRFSNADLLSGIPNTSKGY